MSKAKTQRTRKHRRSLKAVMRHGKNAKRRHRRTSGRTGSVFQKQLASRSVDLNMGRLGLPPISGAPA